MSVVYAIKAMLSWGPLLFVIAPLSAQVADEYQPNYLFTTLFMGIAGESASNKKFIEYDDQKLPHNIALYDTFFQKNYPEIPARAYCAYACDESKKESLEDSSAALLGHLDALRLRFNEKGVEPIIQCEICGDHAAEIFLACLRSSAKANFPHTINTASFYGVSPDLLSSAALPLPLIRRAYFFMQKGAQNNVLQIANQLKDMACITVLCDTMPKAIAKPWWVLAPVFLRHLWVLASSNAEISLSTLFTDSAVLTCGKSKIDVSNALFPVLKKHEQSNDKKNPPGLEGGSFLKTVFAFKF